MGKLHSVVNMETSPRFLVAFVLLLAIAAASGFERSDDTNCDPKPKKGVDNECASKKNQYCADGDGDGEWHCECNPGFTRDHSDFCLPSTANFDEESDGEYIVTDGKTFYYQEKNDKNYVDAHAECKLKFGGNGRLYEPRNETEFKIVAAVARSLNKATLTWIGIRTQPLSEDREFYYLTQGPQEKKKDSLKFEAWAKGEPNDFQNKEDCVSILQFGDVDWEDSDCDDEGFFICELNHDDGCGSPQFAMDNFCDVENNKAACNWDGGACCNNPFPHWDEHCKGQVGCECLDPNGRDMGAVVPVTTPKPDKCEDTGSAKICKKCKGKKCKKSPCKDQCKKKCKLC